MRICKQVVWTFQRCSTRPTFEKFGIWLNNISQRILKAANQAVPESSRVLEVNPKHPLIRNLADLHKQGKTELAQPLVALLLDDAQLVDGSLTEPVAMGRRLQDLLVQVSSQALQ